MEKPSEDILLKVRSHRSILAVAFRLYLKSLWPMLKKLWLLMACVALLFWVAVMMTVYDLYVFAPVVIVAMLGEFLLWWKTGSWLAQRTMKSMARPARRHWGRMLLVAVMGTVALLPFCALVALPPCILVLAEWESQNSQMMGDAPSMPSYVRYLTALTWFIALVLQIGIRLYIVFVAYYSWGSGEARRLEREEQIAKLSSTL